MENEKNKVSQPCNIQRVSFRVWGNWWRGIGDTERLRLRDKHYPKLAKEHMDIFNCMSKKIQEIYIKEHDS